MKLQIIISEKVEDSENQMDFDKQGTNVILCSYTKLKCHISKIIMYF